MKQKKVNQHTATVRQADKPHHTWVRKNNAIKYQEE